MQRSANALAAGMLVLAGLLLLWLFSHGGMRASGEMRSVVVATRDLSPGELVTRAALDFRDLPESYVEDRHIAADDVERLVGMRVTAAVGGGSSLLWTDLDGSGGARTLAALLPVGMRALALPSAVDLGFAGALQPGDRVDVMFTPRVPDDGSPDEQPTETLLENALVLTSGREADAQQARSPVTLSVTPLQAQQLAHTQGRGVLQLALRNPRDLTVGEAVAVDDARRRP